MRRLLFTGSVLLTLAGCCTDQIEVVCPSLTTVSPEMRQRLSAELKSVDAGSAVMWMSEDWLKLRAAVRGCQKGPH